jgi:hypothetical protein
MPGGAGGIRQHAIAGHAEQGVGRRIVHAVRNDNRVSARIPPRDVERLRHERTVTDEQEVIERVDGSRGSRHQDRLCVSCRVRGLYIPDVDAECPVRIDRTEHEVPAIREKRGKYRSARSAGLGDERWRAT